MIEIEGKGFPALPFGDSDQLRVGDVVAAVGNPYGLEGTATLGIISATMRTEVGHGAFEDFLQIDAAINPGNSGGALVNVRGELVGINTVGPKEPGKATGIGFAIPINMARQITSEIVTHGRIRRGSPGLIVEDLTRGLMASLKTSTTRGAHIIEVVANSSAAGLGIKPGGIIVKVSGKPVRGAAEFHTRVETVPVGTKVPAVIEIDGQAREFMLVVGPLVMKPAESTLTQNLGSLAGAVVSDIALGNPLFGNLRGAQVLRVPKTAPAYATGIEAGDVIVGLDGATINSASDLASLADRAGMLFRVKILRDGNPAWVRVSR